MTPRSGALSASCWLSLVGAVAVALVLVNLWRSGLVYEYRHPCRFRAVCRQKGLADRIKTDKGRRTLAVSAYARC